MKKSKKISVQQCDICYDIITKKVNTFSHFQTKGILDSCNHYFCFECIMNWSKSNITCPKCRQQFSKVEETRHRLSRKYSKGLLKNKKIHQIEEPEDSSLGSPILISISDIFIFDHGFNFRQWTIQL